MPGRADKPLHEAAELHPPQCPAAGADIVLRTLFVASTQGGGAKKGARCRRASAWRLPKNMLRTCCKVLFLRCCQAHLTPGPEALHASKIYLCPRVRHRPRNADPWLTHALICYQQCASCRQQDISGKVTFARCDLQEPACARKNSCHKMP